MPDATLIDDAITKAKIKAMAWLATHHQVTVGQMLTYLFMVRREHVTPIIDAWKAHGVSAELVQALVDRFAPKAPATAPAPKPEETAS